MALTKTQIEYAKERVTKACRAYIEAQVGPEPEHEWTDDQRLTLIRTSAVPLKKNVEAAYYPRLLDSFDFPPHPNEKLYKAWFEKAETVKAEATAKAEAIIDRLVLSPDGLSVLNELSAAFGSGA